MSRMDWLQAHCRRLMLRGLTVQAWIGIHDFEKAAPQRLMLDVDIYVRLADTTPQADAIAEVLDYDFVRDAVHERIARGPIGLQETLGDELLATLMDQPGVMAVRVRTAKPDVYPDCEFVGVETFRFNESILRNEAP
ncbi:dihydroneopterin aldolase [Paracidovorax wautersii]|uniref:dihydroneopterin aldolase n=1 Tax=Paracidovorax wautersii TaxID=1177982 RepID=UPI0031D986DD